MAAASPVQLRILVQVSDNEPIELAAVEVPVEVKIGPVAFADRAVSAQVTIDQVSVHANVRDALIRCADALAEELS